MAIFMVGVLVHGIVVAGGVKMLIGGGLWRRSFRKGLVTLLDIDASAVEDVEEEVEALEEAVCGVEWGC